MNDQQNKSGINFRLKLRGMHYLDDEGQRCKTLVQTFAFPVDYLFECPKCGTPERPNKVGRPREVCRKCAVMARRQSDKESKPRIYYQRGDRRFSVLSVRTYAEVGLLLGMSDNLVEITEARALKKLRDHPEAQKIWEELRELIESAGRKDVAVAW